MANGFIPFLQIIHVSDLHVVSSSYQGWKGFRFARRFVRRFSSGLERELQDGAAPHDPMAVYAFADFLEEVTVKDRVWANLKTWIVDTGDLTTFGDTASISKGLQNLRMFVGNAGTVSIFGNHDAWPSEFPLFSSTSSLLNQPQVIASNGYTVGNAMFAMSATCPNGRSAVQLYSVDSVMFDALLNSAALGSVSGAARSQLAALVDSQAASENDFRILLVHHPVHYPTPPRLRLSMVMMNDGLVARFLDGSTPGGKHPLVHLVLSGHTHALFPGHGQLPVSVRMCNHWALGQDQCQLVVGSLMQLDRFSKRGDWPHQSQVLRFYYDSSKPDVVRMERLLAARRGGKGAAQGVGTGPYRFVPVSNDPNRISEEMVFAI